MKDVLMHNLVRFDLILQSKAGAKSATTAVGGMIPGTNRNGSIHAFPWNDLTTKKDPGIGNMIICHRTGPFNI